MEAKTMHPAKINLHKPVFQQHYPFFTKEEELVK
jgi:hypothetical protein